MCRNLFDVVILTTGNEEEYKITLDSLDKQTYRFYQVSYYSLPGFKEIVGSEISHLVSSLQGEYIIFLQEGDVLSGNALQYFAQALSQEYIIAYSDEKISDISNENRAEYIAKPDFSQILFLNYLYIGKAVAFKRNALAGLQLQYTGHSICALLYEIIFDLVNESNIAHIRKALLIPRRNLSGFCSRDSRFITNKINQYFTARNEPYQGTLRIDDKAGFIRLYPTEQYKCQISIIIITEDWNELVRAYSDIQENESLKNAEVIAVLAKKMNQEPIPGLKVIEPEKYDYGSMIYTGCSSANGDILLIMNSSMDSGNSLYFDNMLNFFWFQHVAAVSPHIVDIENNTVYGGTAATGIGYCRYSCQGNQNYGYTRVNREISILSPHFFMIKGEIWKAIQDDLNYSLHEEFFIADLSFNIINLGHKCVYSGENSFIRYKLPEAKSPNYTGLSYMLDKWSEYLAHDRHFTPEMVCNAVQNSSQLTTVHINPLFMKSSHTKQSKRIFIITHDLSMTGAPIVLTYAMKAMKNEGYQIFVMSPVDGPLRDEFMKYADMMIVDTMLYKNDYWLDVAASFDLAFVNTIVPYECIQMLEQIDIPVIWWLHDAKMGYEETMQFVLPESVGDNINIYSVSKYALDVLNLYRPGYFSRILQYGLPDYRTEALDDTERPPVDNPEDKLIFVSIGTIEERKGQDILSEAILLLEKERVEKCIFVFIGKIISGTIFAKIENVMKEYPDNILWIPHMTRSRIFALYRQADCVVCASRDDPLPTFVTEGMMMGKICICSEFTGSASFIQHGENGYVYPENNANHLKNCISHVIDHYDELEPMKQRSRETYEKYFSENSFQLNIAEVINQCMTKGMQESIK